VEVYISGQGRPVGNDTAAVDLIVTPARAISIQYRSRHQYEVQGKLCTVQESDVDEDEDDQEE